MKDIKKRPTGSFTVLYVLISFLWLLPLVVQAKQNDSLSTETTVYFGRLENGFTYFIKPIKNPGEEVRMELIIKSGTQRQSEGEWELAHFLEHLPITQFLNNAYLSKGRTLKALNKKKLKVRGTTGFDHTRYTFNFPQGDSYLRNTGLKYFSEIALGNLQLDSFILDTEKAMLYEEIINRSDRGIYNKHKMDALISECFIKPVAYDSLWKHITEFEEKHIQQFLKKWYRPELSSLIIVGPIEDLGNLKSRIERVFFTFKTETSKINESGCAQKFLERLPQFVVLNNANNVSSSRKEVIFHLFIRDNKEIKDLSTAQWEWIKPILSQSITELLMKQQSYNKRHVANANWHEVLPLIDIKIKTEIGHEAQALKETYALIKRLKRYGITQEEWKEIKIKKSQELKRKDITSMNYWMYELRQQALTGKEAATEDNLINWWDKFSLKDYNAILHTFIPDIPDDIGAIVPVTAQKDPKYWKSNIQAWLATSTAGDIKTWPSEVNLLEFNDTLDRKGYKELSRDIFGARVFKLSNGLQVILKEIPKPLNKEGNISIHGFRKKGGLNFSEEDYYNAMLSPYVIRNAGVGNLDKFQIQNIISGTSIARIFPYVTDTESGIVGSSGEKDIKTFFQLIYHYIASPRKDSVAFEYWQGQEFENFLHPKVDKVKSDFKDKVGGKLQIPKNSFSVSERYRAVQEIEMDEAYRIYHSIFNQANDFTFLVSSSVEAEKLLPLVDKFLGNLPNVSQKNNLKSFTGGGKLPAGPLNKIIEIPSIPYDNVMLSVQYLKAVELSDWKTSIRLKILAEVLLSRIRNLRVVKRRAIYDSYISYNTYPEVNMSGVTISLPTIKYQCDLILEDIKNIIFRLSQEPLKKEELDVILQQKILPEYVIESDQNISTSLENLYYYYRFEALPLDRLRTQEYISSLTPEMILEFAQQFLIEKNKYVIIGKPTLR